MTNREAVEAVKKRLWTFGYSVNDYSQNRFVKFDLLLNERYRMIVGKRRLKNLPKNIEIYVQVDEDGQMLFLNKDGEIKSPTKII